MAAGLVLPVAGPYLATWQALPLGTQNDDGFVLKCTVQGQDVNESDAYGMSLVEGIYRGQNWRLRPRRAGVEKWTGLLGSLQMFGQTGMASTLTPVLANIGDRLDEILPGGSC